MKDFCVPTYGCITHVAGANRSTNNINNICIILKILLLYRIIWYSFIIIMEVYYIDDSFTV